MTIHPYLNQSGISISAHRGGSEEAPENTLESFSYAIGLGSSYIETDVQLSADGIPYIFHDDDLSRLLNMALHAESTKTLVLRKNIFAALNFIETPYLVMLFSLNKSEATSQSPSSHESLAQGIS